MKKVKYLHTFGKFDLEEYDGELPEMSDDQIEIKTILCGICRSDICAYIGGEIPQPILHQGHEGAGEVVRVGKNIKNAKVGDFVATWSDPAYADYYYAKENEFVIIPELSHKYILQPVASAVNIAEKTVDMFNQMPQAGFGRILLLGSGFMSFVVARILEKYDYEYTVCGSSHREIWKEKFGIELKDVYTVEDNSFDCVIDLTSKAENFNNCIRICKNEGLICYASTPYTPVTTNFFETCWKCHTWIFPSPRNSDFNEIMAKTRDYISEGFLDTDWMWSKGYDRSDMNQVKQAFEDGANREGNYIRGYIKW